MILQGIQLCLLLRELRDFFLREKHLRKVQKRTMIYWRISTKIEKKPQISILCYSRAGEQREVTTNLHMWKGEKLNYLE